MDAQMPELAAWPANQDALDDVGNPYRRALESLPAAIVIVDEGLRIRFLNPAARRLVDPGLLAESANDLNGLTANRVFPWIEASLQHFSTNPAGNAETEVVTLIEGAVRQFSVRFSALARNGGFSGAVMLMNDITERVQTEKRLFEALQLQTHLYDIATILIVTFNRAGRVTGWNPAAETLTGLSKFDVQGRKDLWDRILADPHDRSRLFEMQADLHVHGKPIRGIETRIQGPDKRLHVVSWHGTPVTDADARTVGSLLVGLDVTETHEARAALMQSEERFRKIFAEAPVGYFLMDEMGMVHDGNQAAERLLACPRDQLLGLSILQAERFGAPFVDGVRERMMQVLHGASLSPLDLTVQRSAGGPVTVEFNAHPILLGGQRFLLGVIRDITRRVAAERRLKENEERYALAVAGSNDGLWDWDFTSDTMYFSPRYKAMVGCTDEDMPNHLDEMEKRLHPEDHARVKEAIQSYIAGERDSFDIEFRLLHKDNSYRWILSRGKIVRDDDGKPLRFSGSHMDLTEKKQTEEALRRIARFEEAVARVSSRFISAPDLDTAVNQSLRELGELSEADRATIYAFSPDGQTMRATYRWQNPDVTFVEEPPLVKSLPWMSDQIRRYGVLIISSLDRIPASAEEERDYLASLGYKSTLVLAYYLQGEPAGVLTFDHMRATHEWRSDEMRLMGVVAEIVGIFLERAHLETQLRLSQKMESIGQLAAGIAHEINTPIQFVGDSLHFLKTAFESYQTLTPGYTPPEDAPEFEEDWGYLNEQVPRAFERTFDGITRVTTIVRSMKEFAHPDRQEKLPADLRRAITNTTTVARNEYKYVADLKTELEDIPPVSCYIGEINQVILNLIVNAAHAIADKVGQSSERGLITIRTRALEHDVEIAVSDTGTGIPTSIRSRIFDPFFTTKEVGKGTGQGLAIAYRIIVEKHGGQLSFETEEGKGTTFFIRLPVGAEESAEPKETP